MSAEAEFQFGISNLVEASGLKRRLAAQLLRDSAYSIEHGPMTTAEEIADAYQAKLEAMVNEGRVDTSKLDAIAERIIVEIIQRELRDIVDKWTQEERGPKQSSDRLLLGEAVGMIAQLLDVVGGHYSDAAAHVIDRIKHNAIEFCAANLQARKEYWDAK